MKKEVNSEIARIFYEIADILEINKINYKPQAYRLAAQTIESLNQDLSEIYKKQGEKAIDELPGIGKHLTAKIIQYIKTGKIKEYQKIKKSLPKGIYEIMQIPGIGVKKASLFYNELKIKSVEELKRAAETNQLTKIPGFKQKAQEKILEELSMKKKQNARIPLKQAEYIANSILKEIKKFPGTEKAVIAGSIRRRKPTIGDIDIIIQTNNPKQVIEKFTKIKYAEKIINKGTEKATIISKGIQIDIRIAKQEFFGACLIYFTGDKQHNIWLRKVAIKHHLKLSEYGLFKNNKRIAGKTEQEVYSKLNLKTPQPEKRIGKTE